MMDERDKLNGMNIATVCGTVNTGFEHLALQECTEKLGSTASSSRSRTVKKFRGRIVFEIPVQDIEKAAQLRSVDNLSVVVSHIKDVDLNQEKDKVISDLCQKILESNWKLALDTWRQFTKSELCLDPLPGTLPSSDPGLSGHQDVIKASQGITKDKSDDSPEEVLSSGQRDSTKGKCDDTPGKVPSSVEENNTRVRSNESSGEVLPCGGESDARDKSTESPKEAPSEEIHPGEDVTIKRPTFRVTCTRTGEKHQFNSRDVAPAVGSLVNETFGWPVKMKEYDIEVVVNILEDSTMVSVSLTTESLHRRNITHFGITTLKATLAYCMLRMAQPKPGEIIMDPMCGVGGIPLEALIDWKSCHVVAGDVNDVAVERTRANLDSLSEKRRKKHITRPDIENDVLQWDVTNLPLKTSSVDVFVTDLPFGKRLGSRRNNWSLYHKCLEEMARVCCPGTGRAVLLTQDKKCMVQTLQRCQHLWRKKNTIFINHGGLKAGVYLLQRAKVKNNLKKRNEQEGGGDTDGDQDGDPAGERDQEDNSIEQGEMECA